MAGRDMSDTFRERLLRIAPLLLAASKEGEDDGSDPDYAFHCSYTDAETGIGVTFTRKIVQETIDEPVRLRKGARVMHLEIETRTRPMSLPMLRALCTEFWAAWSPRWLPVDTESMFGEGPSVVHCYVPADAEWRPTARPRWARIVRPVALPLSPPANDNRVRKSKRVA
jgi:hypothetical protein